MLNTNLRWDTTKEIIEEGFKILKEVSEELNIPIIFLCIDERRKDLADGIEVDIFPLKLFVSPIPIQ